MIECEEILMYCGYNNFIYHSAFSRHITLEGDALENVFDYFFDVGAENFFSEKVKRYLDD